MREGEICEGQKVSKVGRDDWKFYLVMGNVCKFHTRGLMSQIAYVTERYGWNGGMRIDERVVFELKFWRKNLRDLNGWEMRMLEKVVYCKDGQVEMFSDASDLQVGGARF